MVFDIAYTLVAFLVAISILIAVHEFGHFWVAKRLGVKVLRYSIGFGRPLWRRVAGPDRTEYVLAALPLGGYVKMLDEREGEVAPEDRHRAFNRQSVAKRFAIVFAGPAFNFLFAIFAYWVVFVVGVSGIKPVIGDVAPDSPAAAAGLHAGQTIVAVNGEATPIWDAALQAMLPGMLDRGRLQLTVAEPEGGTREHTLDLSRLNTDVDPSALFGEVGLAPWRPPIAPVVGRVVEGSPAAGAGLQVDDRILEVDGKPIADWYALVEAVQQHADRALAVTIRRDGAQQTLRIRPRADKDGEVRIGIAPKQTEPVPESKRAVYHYGPLPAIGESLSKTWEMSALTLKMLGKIAIGEASLKNLSGPISIASYAGHSARSGPARFFDFLAIVSISLGILNLLPVPVLDGGHLMFYLVELVKGRPVSERTEAAGQRLGLVLLLMLMTLAFYNDLMRLFG